MNYELYFFKENTRNIDIDALLKYFNSNDHIVSTYGDEEALFTYKNQDIGFEAKFHLTRTKRVTDIYRLNPRYLDLDLYLSFDLMSPMFAVNQIIELVQDMCARFQFFIYNPLFENVTSFKAELITGSFDLYRRKQVEMHPAEYSALNYMKEEVVTDIFKYISERKQLETYFKKDNYFFPIPTFIRSKNSNRTYITVDLKDDVPFVFPPRTDIVVAYINENFYLVYYDELLSVIGKYTTNIPGFIQSSRVLTKQGIKKINHIITHEDFTKIHDDFEIVDIESIVDFK